MTDGPFVFKFEELGEDLARAPLAAQRLFRWTGIQLSARGWSALRPEMKRTLATEGSREIIEVARAQRLFTELPMREVAMVPPFPDFESQPRGELEKALGLNQPLTPEQWRALPGLARFALNALSANARLLWRAMGEIRGMAGGRVAFGRNPFRGLVASCELALDQKLPSYEPIMRLLSGNLMFDGKGFLLARAAGLRAARRTQETLDMQAETVCGPVELGWYVDYRRGIVLWQAHVSTWGGEFYPAASLLAVTTAATALLDMMYEVQQSASLKAAHIAEDAWRVGREGDEEEEKTTMFAVGLPSSRG
jgi:molybdenum cofactor biosynthesis enzyme